MVALPFQSDSCVRCCLGRSAASVSFLRRGNTLKALQLHNQKKKHSTDRLTQTAQVN